MVFAQRLFSCIIYKVYLNKSLRDTTFYEISSNWKVTTAFLHQPIFLTPKAQFAWELSLQNRLEKKHSQTADIIKTKYLCSSWNVEDKLLCTLDLVFEILYLLFIHILCQEKSIEEMNFVQKLTFCHDSACGSCTFPKAEPFRTEKHLTAQKDWSSKPRHVCQETWWKKLILWISGHF